MEMRFCSWRLVLCVLSSVMTTHSHEPEGYTECNKAMWKVHTLTLTFPRAISHCQSEKASLAIVRTPEERACFREVVSEISLSPTMSYFWIALSDIVTEGKYVWSDGVVESPNSSNWFTAGGQPGPGSELSSRQDCGYAVRAGWLGDQDCSAAMPFVCKAAKREEGTTSSVATQETPPSTILPSTPQSTTFQPEGTPRSSTRKNATETTTESRTKRTRSMSTSSTTPADRTSSSPPNFADSQCRRSSCSGLSTAGVIVTALSACIISSLATSLICVCMGIHRTPDYPTSISGESSTPSRSSSHCVPSLWSGLDRPLPRVPERVKWPVQTAAYDVVNVVLQNPACRVESRLVPVQSQLQRASSPHYIQLSQP